MPRRWPPPSEIDEAYRAFKQRERELDDLLHGPTRRKQTPEQPQPQPPEEPLRKRKEGGGRDPVFNPKQQKQQAALQRLYRRYKRKSPHALKKEAKAYLRGWAKRKYGIEASDTTITTHIMMPVDKPRE